MITSKYILTFLFLALSLSSFGQDSWESWDRNYRPVNFIDLVKMELSYADSIENNPEIAQYYSRLDKYKITATYLGEKRPVDQSVLASMKNVFKLFAEILPSSIS